MLIGYFAQSVNLFEHSRGVLTSQITNIIPELIMKHVTSMVVKASWAATGAHPWNPKVLRRRAREAVKMEILPETPQKRLYQAVTSLLTPPKTETDVKKANLSVNTVNAIQNGQNNENGQALRVFFRFM